MKAIGTFGEALVEVAAVNANVMAVSCDLRGATRLQKFFDAFPDRSIEVGIEANGIGIAAGVGALWIPAFHYKFWCLHYWQKCRDRDFCRLQQRSCCCCRNTWWLDRSRWGDPSRSPRLGCNEVNPKFLGFQPASGVKP